MKINIGSTNTLKINAVKETILLYPKLFLNPEVNGVGVKIEEFGHPKNMDEIINGATERALQAFKKCDFSTGLESGLIAVPKTQSGYMEISACVIYDGQNLFVGLSPAFEWPVSVTKYILQNKGDASLAFKQLKLSNSEKIGLEKGGACAMLTNGRMTREDQIKYSIIMALIHLEKPELK